MSSADRQHGREALRPRMEGAKEVSAAACRSSPSVWPSGSGPEFGPDGVFAEQLPSLVRR